MKVTNQTSTGYGSFAVFIVLTACCVDLSAAVVNCSSSTPSVGIVNVMLCTELASFLAVWWPCDVRPAKKRDDNADDKVVDIWVPAVLVWLTSDSKTCEELCCSLVHWLAISPPVWSSPFQSQPSQRASRPESGFTSACVGGQPVSGMAVFGIEVTRRLVTAERSAVMLMVVLLTFNKLTIVSCSSDVMSRPLICCHNIKTPTTMWRTGLSVGWCLMALSAQTGHIVV